MTANIVARPAAASGTACDPATRVTRSLLGYGVIAGPVYVTVSLAQVFTRRGFDPLRHEWSLLANGHLGWIQIANFVLSGLMMVAAAAGLRRAMGRQALIGRRSDKLRGGRQALIGRRSDKLRGGRQALIGRRSDKLRGGTGRWAPRLWAGYGLGLVSAGIFRADPSLGFPPGTPAGPGAVSWHGMLHLVSAMIGFGCLIASCVVLARRMSAEGRRGWAACSWGTGVVFLAAFAGVASGGGSVATTLGFVAAVLLAWAWIAAMSVHYYRSAN